MTKEKATEYNEFLEWLAQCCQTDEENIHELKLSTSQCKRLWDAICENSN